MIRRLLQRAAGPQLQRAAAAACGGPGEAAAAAAARRGAATPAAAAAAQQVAAAAALLHAHAPLWASASCRCSGSGWQAALPAAARGFATQTQRKAAANPGLKYWKPTTPGQRGRVTVRRTGIWRGGPKRCLALGASKSGGRNHRGRTTVRHRGGGARKVTRLVDFQRRPQAAGGVVERLEYDPGRSGYIALVRHDTAAPRRGLEALEERAAALRARAPAGGGGGADAGAGADASSGGGGGGDGEYLSAVQELLDALKRERAAPPRKQFSYILAPQELRPGDAVASGEGAPIRPGNTMRLRDIPIGMPMHNLELRPGQGAALCRSAGCAASIVNKQETHAIVRLPSGEQRLFPMECRATIGAVSNPQHQNIVIGKAGYARHMGRRPVVRGVAMNPVDHPHGGGTAGGRPSVTPWGIPCKGYRTRRHNPLARWILVPRKRGKGAAGGPGGGGGGA